MPLLFPTFPLFSQISCLLRGEYRTTMSVPYFLRGINIIVNNGSMMVVIAKVTNINGNPILNHLTKLIRYQPFRQSSCDKGGLCYCCNYCHYRFSTSDNTLTKPLIGYSPRYNVNFSTLCQEVNERNAHTKLNNTILYSIFQKSSDCLMKMILTKTS